MFFSNLTGGSALNDILDFGPLMKLLNRRLGVKDQKLFQRDQIIQQNNLIPNLLRISLILDDVTIDTSDL